MAYFGIDMNSFMAAGGLTAADLGTKPAVAAYNPVSSTTATNESLDAISQSMGRFTSIASDLNSFNQDQIDQMQEMYAPGSAALRSDTTKALDQQLQGLPSAVMNDIMRSSAASSVQAGISGSPTASAAAMTQVGLASLKQIDQTISASTSFMDSLSKSTATPFNIASLMVTPQTQLGVDTQNEQGTQTYQQNVNNVNAAPTPAGAFWENLGSQLVGSVVAQQLKNGGNGGGSGSSYTWGNPPSSSYGSSQLGSMG